MNAPSREGYRPAILVAGIGHTLMGDDALGPRVIEHLEREGGLGPAVELRDFGTSGAHLAEEVLDRDYVIVIDAVTSAEPVGTIACFDLMSAGGAGLRMSLHQPDVAGAISLAQLLGRAPRAATLFGAVVQRTDLGLGLSPAVEMAVEVLAQRVVDRARAWQRDRATEQEAAPCA